MRKKEEQQWRCTNCNYSQLNSQLLTAPHPFIDGDIVCGCMQCKSIEGFDEICNIEGCTLRATGGSPTTLGCYLRMCHQHLKELST